MSGSSYIELLEPIAEAEAIVFVGAERGASAAARGKLQRQASSINLNEDEPSSELSPEDVCKGKPEVLGGWTRGPPRKKRYEKRYEKKLHEYKPTKRIFQTPSTFETPGKRDCRGRPVRVLQKYSEWRREWREMLQEYWRQ